MSEIITENHRAKVVEAYQTFIGANTDSVSARAKQFLMCALDAGLTCSDLERAIEWWRGPTN